MLQLLGHLQLAAQQAGGQLVALSCLAPHLPLPGGASAASAADPVARGELLLSALIALGRSQLSTLVP